MHEIFGLVIIAGVVLAMFGPKTLQSLAHTMGKTAGKAKQAKDDVMADLSLDEVAKLKKRLADVPLSPQQAVQKLLTTENKTPVTSQSTAGPVSEINRSEPAQE